MADGTVVQSGNVELQLDRRTCDGCGAETDKLFEDGGMNWLCADCIALEDED